MMTAHNWTAWLHVLGTCERVVPGAWYMQARDQVLCYLIEHANDTNKWIKQFMFGEDFNHLFFTSDWTTQAIKNL